MADKTITYKGKRIKVNDRDRVLYTMVKQGLITEDDLERLQRDISSRTSASDTVVAVRENFRSGFQSSGGGEWDESVSTSDIEAAADMEAAPIGAESGLKTYKITVDGKKMVVNSRDHYLYRRYNRGELTMGEVRRWQGDVPAGANAQETIDTMRGVIQQERQDAPTEGMTTEEYNALSREEQAIAKFDVGEGAADAILKLFKANLIDWNELQTLTYMADEEWDAANIYGVAIEEFDIPDGEWESKAPSQNIIGLDELERRRPTFSERARQISRWGQRGERDRELGGDESLFGTTLSDFTAKVPRVEKSKALIEALENLPEGSISDKDRAKAIHDAERFRWESVSEIIGDARTYIDDETALSAFDTALSMPDTVAEMDAKDELLEGVPTGEERQAELSAYETMRTEGEFYATDISTGADISQLNTLQDFAEYIGFVGPDDQAPLNVVVETGITGEDGDQEALIYGDVPAYMFYDKATGRYWNAAQQERYLQGQLAYERGYTGQDLPGGTMEQYRDIVTAPYSEGTQERFQAIGGAQGAFLAMEHGAEYKPTIGTQFPNENLPWERQAYNWQPGGARAWADSMTGADRRKFEREYKKAGFYDVYDDSGRKYFTNPNDDSVFVGISNEILRVSRGRDIDPLRAIGVLKDERTRVQNEQSAFLAAEQARAKIVSAPTKLPFSIPRELRYIPDYKTITTEMEALFFAEMGREILPGEREDLAASLTGYHETAQQAKIRMAYASWEGNDSEVMDPGELERIGDPGSQLTYDIKNKFASEINLNKRQETNADSFSRVINATRGAEVGTPVAASTNVVGR